MPHVDLAWLQARREQLRREAEQAKANWTAQQGALQLLDQMIAEAERPSAPVVDRP
jgi:hypothetical protein